MTKTATKATVKTTANKNSKSAKKPVMPVPVPVKDVYGKEIITELNRHVKAIRSEMDKMESSFTKIAFNLYWIYNNGSFKSLGADNIYSFAKSEFGISRGTTSNFINVVERFGKKVDGHILPEIAEEYRDFKSSQLVAMLGMNDETVKLVNKEMPVREIAKLKKQTSGSEKEGRHSTDRPEKSEKEENVLDGTVVDVDSTTVNRAVMLTIKDLDDYLKHVDTMDMQIRRLFSARGKKYRVEISCIWD